jgi:5-methylcytosine-specific restriction protein A
MPASRACANGSCPNLQPCPAHVRTPWAGQPSRHERGYGSDWATRRKRILDRDKHNCRLCPNRATTVDHIKPKAEGGTDDDDNLASLCWPCHMTKTGREGAAGRKRTLGAPR